MTLTLYRPLGITIAMKVFATGVAGQLRVVLALLSTSTSTGPVEKFYMAFYDETSPQNGTICDHIEVPATLARSIVAAPQFPNTADEHQNTLDAVLYDPNVLGLVESLANTHGMLTNITAQVEALKLQSVLQNLTPTPTPPPAGGNGNSGSL